MSQFQKSVSIDNQTYLITQFSPTKSIRLLTKLLKIVGGPLAAMALEGGMSSKDSEKYISQAVLTLADRLEENQVEQVLKEILEAVHVDNVPVTQGFDSRFQGKLGLIFKLAIESLKVQYGNFSDALGGLVDRGKAMAVSKAQ